MNLNYAQKKRIQQNRETAKSRGVQHATQWLVGEKAEKFMRLVEIVAKEVGGKVKAFNLLEIGTHLQDDLYHKRISENTAKKILKNYKRYKAGKLVVR